SNNHHRHLNFHKRPSMTTSQSRHTNSNIPVERHSHINNIYS
ncbi:unnamed protein product, partial [Rotaria sp. Silwood2]